MSEVEGEAAALLRATVTEEFGLSKHYEQQQNFILGALFAFVGGAVGLRQQIAHITGWHWTLAVITLGWDVAVLVLAAARAGSLSILSFHAAATCRNRTLEAVTLRTPLRDLLQVNFRDAGVNALPWAVRQFMRLPFVNVYLVILSAFLTAATTLFVGLSGGTDPR